MFQPFLRFYRKGRKWVEVDADNVVQVSTLLEILSEALRERREGGGDDVSTLLEILLRRQADMQRASALPFQPFLRFYHRFYCWQKQLMCFIRFNPS